ncbi:hypothetical protein CpPA04_0431 [Corynebacterium pseudotuberculosis]|nr:hypothetical protein CpPA04_0431 [Corynebacterium pseudotuberculosis]ATQ64751.1 Hypothetical protein CpPA07_0432 [Corynebacterium pseudotuberculosis]
MPVKVHVLNHIDLSKHGQASAIPPVDSYKMLVGVSLGRA